MKRFVCLFVTVLCIMHSCIANQKNTKRSIDIENDSAYPMHIVANTHDLSIDHEVPARSHSVVSVNIKAIPGAQELLMNAITNNSLKQFMAAIIAGADVNRSVNGKKPLEWALLLGNIEVVEWLVEYGAVL